MSDTSTDTHASKAEKQNPLLKMALELGPLLIFFFGNLRGEWLAKTFPELTAIGGALLIATALFMVATVISLIISKIVFKHLPVMPFVSGIVVLVFGGLSIWLQDETFIKMKPTIVNTLFGVVLLGGLAFGTSLLGYVFNAAFHLDAVHALVDESAVHILEEIVANLEAAAERLGRRVVVVAESDRNDPATVTPRRREPVTGEIAVADGGSSGLGLTGQWADDIHHALHVLLTGETQGYY